MRNRLLVVNLICGILCTSLGCADMCGEKHSGIKEAQELRLWINDNEFVNGSRFDYKYFYELAQDGNSGVTGLLCLIVHGLEQGLLDKELLANDVGDVLAKLNGHVDGYIDKGFRIICEDLLSDNAIGLSQLSVSMQDRMGYHLPLVAAFRTLGSYIIKREGLEEQVADPVEFATLYKKTHARTLSALMRYFKVNVRILDSDMYIPRNFETASEKYTVHEDAFSDMSYIALYPYAGHYYMVSKHSLEYFCGLADVMSALHAICRKPKLPLLTQHIPEFICGEQGGRTVWLEDLIAIREAVCEGSSELLEWDLSKEAATYALAAAIERRKTKLIKGLLEKGADVGDCEVLLSLTHNEDLRLVKFLIDCGAAKNRKFLLHILRSKNPSVVRAGIKQIPNRDKALIIGLTYFYGNWTDGIIRVLDEAIINKRDDAYLVSLTDEIYDDEKYMPESISELSIFSCLINPGAADSFPTDKSMTKVKREDIDQLNSLVQEGLYPKVVEYATKHEIPYLGICAGAQAMVLANNGSLEWVEGHVTPPGQKAKYVKISIEPGSIPHFMVSSEEEQEKMLKDCEVSKVVIEGNKVNHKWAANPEALGEGVNIAGWSELGAPEVFYMGVDKVAIQSHPERAYVKDIKGVNRQKIFLDSFFKVVERYHKTRISAQEKGISMAEWKQSLREANEALVGRLAWCKQKSEKENARVIPASLSSFIDKYLAPFWGADFLGEDKVLPETSGYLWGDIVGDYEITIPENESNVTIKILPGLKIEDLGLYRKEGDLILCNKRNQKQLTIKGHFIPENKYVLRSIDFADGSKIIPPTPEGVHAAIPDAVGAACMDARIFSTVYDKSKEKFVIVESKKPNDS